MDNPLTIGTTVRVDTPHGNIWVGEVIGFSEKLDRVVPDTVSRELRLRLGAGTDSRIFQAKGANVPPAAWEPRTNRGWSVRKLVQDRVWIGTSYLSDWIYPPMERGDLGEERWGPLRMEVVA